MYICPKKIQESTVKKLEKAKGNMIGHQNYPQLIKSERNNDLVRVQGVMKKVTILTTQNMDLNSAADFLRERSIRWQGTQRT